MYQEKRLKREELIQTILTAMIFLVVGVFLIFAVWLCFRKNPDVEAKEKPKKYVLTYQISDGKEETKTYTVTDTDLYINYRGMSYTEYDCSDGTEIYFCQGSCDVKSKDGSVSSYTNASMRKAK